VLEAACIDALITALACCVHLAFIADDASSRHKGWPQQQGMSLHWRAVVHLTACDIYGAWHARGHAQCLVRWNSVTSLLHTLHVVAESHLTVTALARHACICRQRAVSVILHLGTAKRTSIRQSMLQSCSQPASRVRQLSCVQFQELLVWVSLLV
jgi:hypothetical protein